MTGAGLVNPCRLDIVAHYPVEGLDAERRSLRANEQVGMTGGVSGTDALDISVDPQQGAMPDGYYPVFIAFAS